MEEFGMVLSGGGAKGMYQVGVFNALMEYDIKITSVSGASAGGINAYAYACLNNSQINELWDNFKFEDFFDPDDDWSDGISDRVGLETLLQRYVDEYKLKSAIPVYNSICETSEIAEYRKLNDYSKEDVIKIILATSAMPVIYSKVNIDDRYYQDGGVADNLPVMPLYLDGVRNLIVVGLSKDLRIDNYRFPTEKLIEIYPSYDLGDLIDGTLNFSDSFKSKAKKLGYADAKRALNNYFGIDNGCHTAEFDYNQIMSAVRVEKLQSSIDDTMSKLSKYF